MSKDNPIHSFLSGVNNNLTKEQQELLQRLTDELMGLATEVVEDYNTNPTDLSGSTTQVHVNSPTLLDDDLNDSE